MFRSYENKRKEGQITLVHIELYPQSIMPFYDFAIVNSYNNFDNANILYFVCF